MYIKDKRTDRAETAESRNAKFAIMVRITMHET